MSLVLRIGLFPLYLLGLATFLLIGPVKDIERVLGAIDLEKDSSHSIFVLMADGH